MLAGSVVVRVRVGPCAAGRGVGVLRARAVVVGDAGALGAEGELLVELDEGLGVLLRVVELAGALGAGLLEDLRAAERSVALRTRARGAGSTRASSSTVLQSLEARNWPKRFVMAPPFVSWKVGS